MNLTGHFLIAMPAMQDPSFSKTVTYICTHNEDGAMGIIINRPMQINLSHVLEQIHVECTENNINQTPVYFGGPVQAERGFVLHATHKEYNATVIVNETVSMTSSKDILEETALNQGPEKLLIALGYAGWTAGQLEDEMSQNAWLSLSPKSAADIEHLIFDLPFEQKLTGAMALVGVDFASLSDVAGHA